MTVMDFYKVADITQKVKVCKFIKDDYKLTTLYDGYIEDIPLQFLIKNVIGLRIIYDCINTIIILIE